jgi:hypothetical protein
VKISISNLDFHAVKRWCWGFSMRTVPEGNIHEPTVSDPSFPSAFPGKRSPCQVAGYRYWRLGTWGEEDEEETKVHARGMHERYPSVISEATACLVTRNIPLNGTSLGMEHVNRTPDVFRRE